MRRTNFSGILKYKRIHLISTIYSQQQQQQQKITCRIVESKKKTNYQDIARELKKL